MHATQCTKHIALHFSSLCFPSAEAPFWLSLEGRLCDFGKLEIFIRYLSKLESKWSLSELKFGKPPWWRISSKFLRLSKLSFSPELLRRRCATTGEQSE